jgi:hypothetical protein
MRVAPLLIASIHTEGQPPQEREGREVPEDRTWTLSRSSRHLRFLGLLVSHRHDGLPQSKLMSLRTKTTSLLSASLEIFEQSLFEPASLPVFSRSPISMFPLCSMIPLSDDFIQSPSTCIATANLRNGRANIHSRHRADKGGSASITPTSVAFASSRK